LKCVLPKTLADAPVRVEFSTRRNQTRIRRFKPAGALASDHDHRDAGLWMSGKRICREAGGFF